MSSNLPDDLTQKEFDRAHNEMDEPEFDGTDLMDIETCHTCGGSGVIEGDELTPCPGCNGRGTY